MVTLTPPFRRPAETADAWQPHIFFRLFPRRADTAAFDEWEQSRHCPELVEAPGIESVRYFESVAALPAVYAAVDTRMVWYQGATVDGLFAFMRSDQLAAGLDDGAPWIAKLNELDGDVFTANVYEPTAVERSVDDDPANDEVVFVTRCEVERSQARDFDEWTKRHFLPRLVRHAGVRRARSFSAIRTDVPIPLYRSVGNRMIEVCIPAATLVTPHFLATVAESLRWDQTLGYVKRGVYRELSQYARSGT